jgi:inosose dehydratase
MARTPAADVVLIELDEAADPVNALKTGKSVARRALDEIRISAGAS